eukprot:9313911-Lingulodinium_polyedra.AAC.1
MERAKRTICDPLGRQTGIATAPLRNVCKTLYNDAAPIAVRRRNGSQIARLAHDMRTPILVFAWIVRTMRFASRCLGAAWVLLGCCLGAAG